MRQPNIINRVLFNSKTLAFIGLVIIILISLPLIRNLKKQYEIKKEISDVEKEISTLEGKNSKLNQLIKYLESDQFVEEQARMNLGLKKEGENVAVISGQQVNTPTQTKDTPDKSKNNSNSSYTYSIPGLEKPKPAPNSNPQKWLSYFFK